MKKLMLLTFLASTSVHIIAQDKGFEEGMKAGFDLFTEGEAFEDWVKAAEDLTSLGKQYPQEWLPEYWSSYLYTQLVRGLPEDPPTGVTATILLNESQKNFDKAFQKIKNPTAEIRSDFHALQALIYAFNGNSSKEEIEFKKAIQANPNNPLIDVSLATDLVKRNDYTSLYSARILFLRAKNIYNSRTKPRYMSTHWNEEWLGYWLPQAEKGLETLTKK